MSLCLYLSQHTAWSISLSRSLSLSLPSMRHGASISLSLSLSLSVSLSLALSLSLSLCQEWSLLTLDQMEPVFKREQNFVTMYQHKTAKYPSMLCGAAISMSLHASRMSLGVFYVLL